MKRSTTVTAIPEPNVPATSLLATRAGATYDFGGLAVMITGGAGDIGRATARRFARDGARVALLDVAEEGLRQAEDELIRAGAEAIAIHCDVTDRDRVEDAVAAVADRFGGVDVVFNNAGYQGAFCPTDAYPADDFERVIDVNVVGVYHVLSVASAHMRRSGGGSIVNTASHAGVRGPPNMLAYGASKFAVVGMTQTAAKDLAPYGIRVNAISPALIGPGLMWERQTELQAATGTQYFAADPQQVKADLIASVPLRRLGTLDEVANVVAWLASAESSYLTGFNVEVTGGI